MGIQDILQKNAIITNINAGNKNELLTRMAHHLVLLYDLKDKDVIVQKILDRELDMSTGIGFGIAIPHARIESIDRVYMVAARSVQGIEFNAIDEQPVHLIFMMLSPTNTSTQYTQTLSVLSRIMSYEEIRNSLQETSDAQAFMDIIRHGEDKYAK